MTVKCVSDTQKTTIAYWYQNKTMNQKEIAKRMDVSERTVNRVLIEAGLATPVQRIKGEAHLVMKLLQQYHLDRIKLETVLAKAEYLGLLRDSTPVQRKASKKSPAGHIGRQLVMPEVTG